MNRVALLLGMFLFSISHLVAQNDLIYIEKIYVEGNTKTRLPVILRELRFAEGDSVSAKRWSTLARESEQLLMNTGLFTRVTISTQNEKTSANSTLVFIKVEENWYLYPIPIFELADRSFNVWWVEQKRSLDRTNFGVEFTHQNLTGRGDRLKVTSKFGYTRTLALQYDIPYLNKQQTIGLKTNVSYFQNKEVNYTTQKNKQIFYREDDRFVANRFQMQVGVSLRPKLRSMHRITAGFFQNQVTDSISLSLNPNYFLKGRDQQRFFSLSYQFAFDKRDFRAYPLSGNYLSFELEKDGLGIFGDRDGLTFYSRYQHYISFSKKMSMGLVSAGKVSFIRSRQPYNDNRAIGFSGNNLQGYEFYIVDGPDMAYLKSSLRYQLLQKELSFGKMMPISSFRAMPLRVFVALNNDWGYVHNPFEKNYNFLNNRLLWGGGVSLDFLLYSDKVFKIEYSINQLWENGVFLHLDMNI